MTLNGVMAVTLRYFTEFTDSMCASEDCAILQHRAYETLSKHKRLRDSLGVRTVARTQIHLLIW